MIKEYLLDKAFNALYYRPKENYGPAFLQKHTIVNLWDMLNFCAEEFIHIFCKIELWSTIESGFEAPQMLQDLLSDIETINNELIKINFRDSLPTIERIKWVIENKPINDKMLNQQLNELTYRIHDEFRKHQLLILSPIELEYYGSKDLLFGDKVTKIIGDLTEDISESSNCYALGRYTACVFHLMRVMEKAVQKLANKIGISITLTCDMEWQTIVNEIRKQLKVIYTKHADPNRVKYESMLGHLETVKIAWRNPTMHPKATYTAEQAEVILRAVKIFMQDLVNII